MGYPQIDCVKLSLRQRSVKVSTIRILVLQFFVLQLRIVQSAMRLVWNQFFMGKFIFRKLGNPCFGS